jgi:hypothetical protein
MRHGNTIPEERRQAASAVNSSPSSNASPSTASYTSEIGFSKELKMEIIPGAQHGCVPMPAEKKA